VSGHVFASACVNQSCRALVNILPGQRAMRRLRGLYTVPRSLSPSVPLERVEERKPSSLFVRSLQWME